MTPQGPSRSPDGTSQKEASTRLPSGTITFLFTDIEGSTTLWEKHREAMGQALGRHDTLLHQYITDHGGHVFKTVGDAFHAVFSTPSQALRAVVEIQKGLLNEPWAVPGGLKARAALHTGIATEQNGDYFGPALNRTARILGVGHGGQIILSHATRELLVDQLPEGFQFLDLGQCRLRDLARNEHLYQVVAPGLPTHFPPPRTLDSRPNNLPWPLEPFEGRNREIEAARESVLRESTRLLTLTGQPNSGRTRIALQVAADVMDTFENGAYFVSAASVHSPALLSAKVANALEISSPGKGPLEVLQEHLGNKQLLLVLTDVEEEQAIGEKIHALLRDSPGLKIVATSLRPLRLPGEQTLKINPLATPAFSREDFPALFRASDQASLSAQRRQLLLFRGHLALLLVAAGAVILATAFEPSNDSGYAIAAVALVLALVVSGIQRGKRYEQVWFDCRAVAESVKTSMWRYMMHIPPYNDSKEGDKEFVRELVEIRQARPGIEAQLPSRAMTSIQITDRMHAIRNLPPPERRKSYLRDRLTDQKNWYTERAELNRSRATLWFAVVMGIQLLALGLAVARIGHWPTPWEPGLTFGNMAALIPLLVTLAAVIVAWGQVRRHDEFNQSYSLAAQELSELEAIAPTISTSEHFQEFVIQVEAAVSREHTLWRARRNVLPSDLGQRPGSRERRSNG